MPYIGKQLVRGQNRELDDISSSFNGATTIFNLTVAGDSVTPGSALQLFISVGGVLQNPNTDFTVAGNQITFSTAPGSGLSFFGYLQGDAVDFNTPADGSVTTSKLGSNLTINVADGSAATPSIQFNGSGTDTGFYSPAADQVAISTNGAERVEFGTSEVVFNDGGANYDFRIEGDTEANLFFVDASTDRVGLGTSSPQETLHIAKTGDSAILQIQQEDSSSTNVYRPAVKLDKENTNLFQLSCDGNASASGTTYYEAKTATGQHIFSVNSSQVVYIDSNGRLLVGTIASPAYQLQVSTDSAGKPSTNTWTVVSDERIKENIELADLDICYEAIKSIPLKRFKWKDEVYTEEQVPDRHKLGWIAQDVEFVFPKAVRVHEFKYNQVFEETVIPAVEEELDEDGNVITLAQPERIEKGELISEDVIEDCRDLNADQLYAAMYGAIQKLIAKVETLEAEVEQLKAQ